MTTPPPAASSSDIVSPETDTKRLQNEEADSEDLDKMSLLERVRKRDSFHVQKRTLSPFFHATLVHEPLSLALHHFPHVRVSERQRLIDRDKIYVNNSYSYVPQIKN